MKPLKTPVLILSLITLSTGIAAELKGHMVWPESHLMQFGVNGIVDQVDVHSGQQVKKQQALASLDPKPFDIRVDKARAGIDSLQSEVLDAQLDMDQAQELYDRTVLSQVDLQKTGTRLKSVKGRENSARADLAMAQWQKSRASLQAPFDARVTRQDLQPGMALTDFNRGQHGIELVPLHRMAVNLPVDPQQMQALRSSKQVKIRVGNKTFPADIVRYQDDYNKKSQVWLEFDTPGQVYYPGTEADVIF